MEKKPVEDTLKGAGNTSEGLPVSPSLTPTLQAAEAPAESPLVDRRILLLCALSICIGLVAALIAEGLLALIHVISNLIFYQTASTDAIMPAGTHLSWWWIVLAPVAGGLIVGFMARYGSKAIRGHGIPEAMESILTERSRIPARVSWLKPLSSAIAIGTGGPFGAEGPIIATGGAVGSLVGQIISTTATERKTLLAAGAAAGMAATFGSPVSAVLLAIELLLFEFRARSFIPVAFASAAATGLRIVFHGVDPIFAMPNLAQPTGSALALYIVVGALVGVVSVYVTRAVYLIEDGFEKLPIHWMWWPAIGALAVGIIGTFAPRTLGVGYQNISDILSAHLTVGAILMLGGMKFVSWAISLSSGTSGGTLAPLFTIGGALGFALGAGAAWLFPGAHVDVRVAALVGMAAIFAGASRTMLTSAVFAFEATLQPLGLLPLLGGCAAAYLVSSMMMRSTIMTEKIVRRGVVVPSEYAADPLEQAHVHDVASLQVDTIRADKKLGDVRQWIESDTPEARHHGFPVVNEQGIVAGVVTRHQLLQAAAESGDQTVGTLIKRPPVIVYDDCTLREAVDHMVNHNLGRLPVVKRSDPSQLVGIITRSDVLSAYRRRLDEKQRPQSHIDLHLLRDHRLRAAQRSA